MLSCSRSTAILFESHLIKLWRKKNEIQLLTEYIHQFCLGPNAREQKQLSIVQRKK